LSSPVRPSHAEKSGAVPGLSEVVASAGVGVSTRETFAVQEIDEDFFTEELG
jgi:hypothetical protein